MHQVKEWIARAAFSRKGRHSSLLSHLDVVLSPPATHLMFQWMTTNNIGGFSVSVHPM
jgi:hypothetical protein